MTKRELSENKAMEIALRAAVAAGKEVDNMANLNKDLVSQYVEEGKKQAIASVIDDVNHQRDMWIRRCGEKDHQIERLERAILQISGNRASEVINACRETFGSFDKGAVMGIAERRS